MRDAEHDRMSASTVDAAVERACAGDAHGPHRPVSAISRGRRGRWGRAAAWTAAAAAALRNARERFEMLMSHSYLELATVIANTVHTAVHNSELRSDESRVRDDERDIRQSCIELFFTHMETCASNSREVARSMRSQTSKRRELTRASPDLSERVPRVRRRYAAAAP